MSAPPTRLVHSDDKAYVRSMQCSTTQIWVFVEGEIDLNFYHALCQATQMPPGLTFRVVRARELPNESGGKKRLEKFFGFLRDGKRLVSVFSGKQTVAVFFLDKDLDDIRHTQKRSEHVIYTKFYSVENHIFHAGNLPKAMAAAALLDESSITARIKDSNSWRRAAATNWIAWVEICFLIQWGKIDNCPNYKVHKSLVHDGAYEPINMTSHSSLLARVEQKSSLTAAEFAATYALIRKKVGRIYRLKEFDRIFNGKWYTQFAVEDVIHAAGGRGCDDSNVRRNILSHLLLTIDYTAAWALHFRSGLSRVIAKLVK